MHPTHHPVPFNEFTAPLFLAVRWLTRRLPVRSERGQATAEYALVLLGAIAVAIALFAFFKKEEPLQKMLERIFKRVNNDVDKTVP